jgi:hypothetical protein
MKSALVIGCASEVWRDVIAAQRLARYDAIYCVKQMGIHYPHAFNVWVTLHPEVMDEYETQRHQKGFPNGYQIVAPPPNELGMHGAKGNITRRASYVLADDLSASAGSGLYGAKVALEDGFDKVVLAGIPMTADSGHFLPKSRNVYGQVRGDIWRDVNSFLVGMEIALPRMQGKVKSMSGYTMKVLGAPSAEWIRT